MATSVQRQRVATDRTSFVNANAEMRVVERRLKNPPDNLSLIENENDLEIVMKVYFIVAGFVKKTTRLTNGLELLSSYYKVWCENFDGQRVSFEELQKIDAINAQQGWRVIRTIYFEPDSQRLVVEVNKLSARAFQAPLGAAAAGSGLPPAMPPFGAVSGDSSSASKKRRRVDDEDDVSKQYQGLRSRTMGAQHPSGGDDDGEGTLSRIVGYMLDGDASVDDSEDDDRHAM